MSGSYQQVGSSDDMKFLDPTGQYSSLFNQAGQDASNYQSLANKYAGQAGAVQGANYDPTAYMNAFLGQSSGLSNLVSGQNSQLQQSLNALAAQQASQGSEAALAGMGSYMKNSGAAAAAYGQAYATPFAQAQAQLQQNQLQGTLNLWNQAMSQDASGYQTQAQLSQQNADSQRSLYSNLASLYGQLGSNSSNIQSDLTKNASAWYTPQYQYQKGALDYIMNILNSGSDTGKALAAMKTAGLF